MITLQPHNHFLDLRAFPVEGLRCRAAGWRAAGRLARLVVRDCEVGVFFDARFGLAGPGLAAA
jgi:hypothetical protein